MMTDYVWKDIWAYGGDTWNNTSDLRRADTNWVDESELLYNNPTSVDYGKPINVEYFADPNDSLWLVNPIWFNKVWVEDNNPSETPVGSNADWYVFRLAETYLLRAEAYFWKGQTGPAANDINMVRQRAEAIPVSAGDVTLDFIFAERTRELWIEEMRHNELVRAAFIQAKLNLNGYSLAAFSQNNWCYDKIMRDNIIHANKPSWLGRTPDMSPHHALWPIHDQVITANTGAVINQNIGYVGAENNIPPLETIED